MKPTWPITPTFTNATSTKAYSKKFAWIPVKCNDNGWVWLQTYYAKTVIVDYPGNLYETTYFVGNLTRGDALVDKLIE